MFILVALSHLSGLFLVSKQLIVVTKPCINISLKTSKLAEVFAKVFHYPCLPSTLLVNYAEHDQFQTQNRWNNWAAETKSRLSNSPRPASLTLLTNPEIQSLTFQLGGQIINLTDVCPTQVRPYFIVNWRYRSHGIHLGCAKCYQQKECRCMKMCLELGCRNHYYIVWPLHFFTKMFSQIIYMPLVK